MQTESTMAQDGAIKGRAVYTQAEAVTGPDFVVR